MLAQSNRRHLSHIAPLCQLLPQLAPECSGHVMALPQLCPKACGSAGCTACTGPFMWLFTFLYLLFSRQRTGSKLFMSFPLTVGNDISPWALGCLRCIAFSQPLPCFPSTNGEITIGIGESRCQAAHLPVFQKPFPNARGSVTSWGAFVTSRSRGGEMWGWG